MKLLLKLELNSIFAVSPIVSLVAHYVLPHCKPRQLLGTIMPNYAQLCSVNIDNGDAGVVQISSTR